MRKVRLVSGRVRARKAARVASSEALERRQASPAPESKAFDGRAATRHLPAGMPRILVAAALAAAVSLVGAVGATGQGSGLVNVLVFHGGASNESVDAGIDAISELGDDNDFDVEATDDPADINPTNLGDYRAVVALHSTGDVLDGAQQSALQAFVQAGGGFLAIGEAAELEPGESFFDNLIGARPEAGSPGAVTDQIVEAGDRVHPATRDLPVEWGPRSDVWYEWEQNPTGQVHTVARVRFGQTADDGWRNGTTSRPIAWCRDFQGGRSFYTGMGRTEDSYSEAAFRDHLLGAIEWTSGMVRAGCKATIASNYQTVRLSNGANGLANNGESHGVVTAPNGWAITFARGDCRTNDERGNRFGGAPTGRITNFAQENVGVGCAPVHIWDPEDYDGTLNSGVTRAGTLTVYGDRGSGNEINGKIETGGLGITVSPDFTVTGHIYVLYFPSFNAENQVHPGLDDGDDRRRTKMGVGRVSRFTIDLDTKQLDLGSEVPIFEYDSQIYSCCHRGGGLGFDSEGNLYITTGDSNSSQGSGGYSGNNPTARCPQRDPEDPDQESASNADCGELNFSYQDARRTAGNTNDYNGKMLRINPIDSIPDGERPDVGIGTTYTLPDESSPNGPNLFDGSEGDGSQAKPEIYAMGLRNPSRLFVDPETDVPYTAWVGPDAGSPNVQQGPSTYEPAAQIPEAANYGWPYCMGDQQAYRDRLANGSLRTTNESGYVPGGPAASQIDGFYDCDNLVNDSPNNTGLEVLPHETATGKDAGTAQAANIWWSRGNPGGNNGCPTFPREHGDDSAPNFGATPTSLCPYVGGGGMTIMNGPVYRYEEQGSNSVRWPEYWDGRWFVHDFSSGNSKSLGLVLDSDGEGVPIYVDRMSQYINWSGGSYMDSKYGPDGALYLQTYDGFFTVGNNVGLHRVAYTGGPDTPNPDPQWQAVGSGEIEFSIGRSGGVAYEWDFGDGSPTSDEPNPVHVYDEPDSYEVTLTVTYADDEEASRTITVNVSDDEEPPTTSAQLDGSDPVDTYDGPVEVELSATDGEGGTGVERTEYRIDGGAFEGSENADEDDPFVTEFTVSGNGERTVEYRSRDRAGNVEEVQSVTFTIETGSGGPGASCLPQSDEFEGTSLDGKWDVLRPTGDVEVADGRVSIPINQGDFIANNTLASDALLQDAPDGEWTVTTKLDTSEIDTNGEQAGLLIWKSESPNTFSKLVAIQSNAGNHQFEHIVTQSGSVNPPIPQSITPAPGGQLPDEVLLRARFDGEQVIGEFSPDDGESWTLVGQEGHAAPFATPIRVGLTAFRGPNGGGEAHFDWFRVHAGSDAGGPIGCTDGGACTPQSDQFDGIEIDPKWEIVNPNAANPPTVGDGHLTLPILTGDLFGTNPPAQNLMLQSAPTDESWVATAKVAHASIDTNGEAAGLALVNSIDPNYFAKSALQYKNEINGIWAERVLTVDGSAVTLPGDSVPWPNSGELDPIGDYLWIRFVYDADEEEYSAWTSLDGVTFQTYGANIPASSFSQNDGAMRVGLFAKHDGSGDDEVDIAAFNMLVGTADPQTSGDDCGAPPVEGCTPQSDQFDGIDLDPKWEIVNPNEDNPATVGDGHLTLPILAGDLFGTNPPAQNLMLQSAPTDESWVATAKVAHASIDTDGEAAGLALVNSIDPNYFAKSGLQYKASINGIWAERVLTVDGSAVTLPGDSVPWPNSGELEPIGDYLWIRFVYDADEEEYSAWTSLDGTEFQSYGANIPGSSFSQNDGAMRVGLFAKHDNTDDDAVDIDAFNLVLGSADPQTPGDDCGAPTDGDTTPPTTAHALDPVDPDGDGGWYVSPVEVTLTATDNEGGSGVDFTEYRFAGDDDWIVYEDSFTVSDDGRHAIQYRSHDNEGNTETTRSVAFNVDATDPETTALLDGSEPVSNYDGPVDLSLEADDGDGSGVRLTEVRVDGGEWQPYVEEEVILDSESDLDVWAQAGPGGLNWHDEEGGFARTFGGLGMPWYPVKDYGDFSLKMQWRDSGAGSNGNSGIFARFPHPEEAVALPPSERHDCQVGNAQSSPAWVAIFCGHEIQINDHQASEPQKTGSVYNFSSLNSEQAQVQPKDTWVDYELRVEGQTYTMIRNGEVLQEWENAPDQSSSRPGDPPTNQRQFARGYIGLQNHGNNDVIDFRDVRILSLDEGTVQGPITIEGEGEHTVEYRSTDVAGNEEETKSVEFTIGDDPGPEPQQVFAQDNFWVPDEVEVSVGDTVRWWFDPEPSGNPLDLDPVTQPHDLWLDVNDTPEDTSDDLQLSEIVLAGSPESQVPVDYSFDETGEYFFYCLVHFGPMRGYVTVTDDEPPVDSDPPVTSVQLNGADPAPSYDEPVDVTLSATDGEDPDASGVDFTEHRVDGGEWVQSDNDEGVDPFVTELTVSDEGQHEVEYRSVDVAGNEEQVRSVEFTILGEGDNRPPVIDAIGAEPSSGTAPLDVQFSAEASDPDDDELTYEWDFDDGSESSDEQNPTHTYTDPGVYEAELTVSDGELETSDSVMVTVLEDGEEDTTPPVTTATLFPTMPGPGGVYDRPVGVTFVASDGEDGSGVDYTEYRVDGSEWTEYNPFDPPVVSGDGWHLVFYRSVDNAGNVEDVRWVEFEIDSPSSLEPVIVAEGRPAARTVGSNRKRVAYRLRATNVGDVASGPLEICARAPERRINIRGQQCRTVDDLAPSASHVERFELGIKKPARGRLTRIRLVVSGPAIDNQRAVVELRVGG